jgi:hypothetical protein
MNTLTYVKVGGTPSNVEVKAGLNSLGNEFAYCIANMSGKYKVAFIHSPSPMTDSEMLMQCVTFGSQIVNMDGSLSGPFYAVKSVSFLGGTPEAVTTNIIYFCRHGVCVKL